MPVENSLSPFRNRGLWVKEVRMEKIETPVIFEDDRGEIRDLVENESINAITTVTLNKGAVRGNHYHKLTTQWNYLMSGKVELISRFDGSDKDKVVMAKGDLVVTFPDEQHVIVAVEDSELIVFTRGPRGGSEYESDTFRLKKPLWVDED